MLMGQTDVSYDLPDSVDAQNLYVSCLNPKCTSAGPEGDDAANRIVG